MLWPAGLGMALGFSVLAAAAWLMGKPRHGGDNVPIQLFVVEALAMLFIALHYGDVEICGKIMENL
jgi:hypothetical protein